MKFIWKILMVLYEKVLQKYPNGRLCLLLKKTLIFIETKVPIIEKEGIVSRTNTVRDNKIFWQNYDWRYKGEEWGAEVRHNKGIGPNVWKAHIVSALISSNIKKGDTVLEIGPGAGRWTEYLIKDADKLYVVDVAQICLQMVKERFHDSPKIEGIVTEECSFDNVEDNSIDFIFSYDTFVHINPFDAKRYIKEIARVLKKGAIAVIHHPGTYKGPLPRFHSMLNDHIMRHLIKRNHLHLIEQKENIAHKQGDVVSVFSKQ